MERMEFKTIRKTLEMTQKEIAQVLAVSLKAVHSYEQGWRTVPPAVERQLYLLLARKAGARNGPACWEAKGCPPEKRSSCPAGRWDSGDLCWAITGTLCGGEDRGSWREKMSACRVCPVFAARVPLASLGLS
ncbi:MAG: transcriptional regulator [Desulfobacterales bacterium]